MTKKKSIKRLRLNKITIDNLNHDEMRQVYGGPGGSNGCTVVIDYMILLEITRVFNCF